MMKIELKLFATISKYLPGSSENYEVPEGNNVAFLIKNLGIPKDEVKLIFVNGKKADLDSELLDGDRVGIFPPVGGG